MHFCKAKKRMETGYSKGKLFPLSSHELSLSPPDKQQRRIAPQPPFPGPASASEYTGIHHAAPAPSSNERGTLYLLFFPASTSGEIRRGMGRGGGKDDFFAPFLGEDIFLARGRREIDRVRLTLNGGRERGKMST